MEGIVLKMSVHVHVHENVAVENGTKSDFFDGDLRVYNIIGFLLGIVHSTYLMVCRIICYIQYRILCTQGVFELPGL
jgi:hypothetical protein